MINRSCYDYSLYVITDQKLAGNRSLATIVQSAINGGATIIQYREKTAATGEMIKQAGALHELTVKAKIPLIVNDRIDVALAIDADGVHVGQEDMPAVLARKLIGSKKILGVSVKTVEQAQQAVHAGADYLGVGDIFGTTSKSDAGTPLGLAIIEEIVDAVSIPVIGIGGITKENATQVIASGANGIAIISAVFGKPYPEEEAKQLLRIIKTAKERRNYHKNIA